MFKFTGKYDVIHEETLNRFQQGGFLAGDYVKIKKDALKNKHLEDIPDNFKSLLTDLIEKDKTLRVAFIKAKNGSGASNTAVGGDSSICFFADVMVENGPGMWKDPVTLPIAVLDKVDLAPGIGYPDVDEDIVYPDRTQIKPQEISEETSSGDPLCDVYTEMFSKLAIHDLM